MDDGNNSGDSPKTGIFDDAKNSYTPDFVQDGLNSDGAEFNKGKSNNFFGKSALKVGENVASDDPNSNGRGGDAEASLGEKEKNVPADTANKIRNAVEDAATRRSDNNSDADKIKNAVQGIAAAKSGNYVKAFSKAKQAGPVLGIILGVIFFGMMMYAGESLMNNSLIAHIKEAGSRAMETSFSRRTDNLLRYQMNSKARVTRYGGYKIISPLSAKEFLPTKRQVKKLSDQGITFENVDGVKVMKFQGKTIVPDSDMVDKVPGSVDLKSALNEGGEFSQRYLQGTMTWRGKVRYWFDTKVGELLMKIRFGRNKTRNVKDSNADELKKVTAPEELDGTKVKMSDEAEITTEGEGERAKTSLGRNKGQTDEFDIKVGDSDDEIAKKVGKVVDAKSNKWDKILKSSKFFSTIANGACLAVSLASSVTAMMKVLQLEQIRQVASTFLEVIDKTQSGEDTNGLMNIVGGIFGKRVTTSYKTDDGKIKEITGSVPESNLAISTYDDKPRAPDASVETLNPTSGLDSFWKKLLVKFGSAGSSTAGFVTCASVKIAAAAVDAVKDAAEVAQGVGEVVACIGGAAVSYGTSCAALLGHIVTKVFMAIGAAAAISAAVQMVTSWLVPKVANMFIRDVSTYMSGGEDTGNAVFAASISTGLSNFLMGGGLLSTKKSYGAYKQVEREYLAEKAHFERQTRSPFDPTSEYTFLGSLMTKFGLLSSTASSPISTLASLGSTVASSVNSLLPHASAISDAETADYLETFTQQYCPQLAGIGALARDAYCNPLLIADVSTSDDDPLAIIIDASKDGRGNDNFESETNDDGMPIIKQDSDLMRYILAVPERQSEFGIIDQNLASSYDLIQNGTAAAAVGAVPVVGSLVDVLNNETALSNLGYITGRAGVAQNDGTGLGKNVASAKKASQYAGLVRDQRALEAMGVIEKSAVTVALEKYYEEHPQDNSFEGILARKTGMTKENVIDTLNLIKLANSIKDYEPAGYYPYVAVVKEESLISFKENNNTPTAYYFIYNNEVSFAVRKEYYIA